MSALGVRRQAKGDQDCEIDMVPIMNLFLVLIPFLLASSNFLNLKAINTSVPVMAESSAQQEDSKKLDVKIKATVMIKAGGFKLEASSSELGEAQLAAMDSNIKKSDRADYGYSELALALSNIKRAYPKSDTLVLVPEDTIVYNTIVKTMDIARKFNGETLFPNVVVSGKVK